MTERPILFSGPMVRALLAGTKTQTRRPVKPQPAELDRPFRLEDGSWHVVDSQGGHMSPMGRSRTGACPYGVPGDLLWVREAHALHERFTDVVRVVYSASLPGAWSEATREFPAERAAGLKIKPFQQGFRPSIHMPRWASRITLRITDVRVERLQDISEADAIAEGLSLTAGPLYFVGGQENPLTHTDPRVVYRRLWEQINGPGSWEENPWIWAVSFEVVV